MFKLKDLLQFFADDTVETGVTDSAAESQETGVTDSVTESPISTETTTTKADRLAALGVPKDKLNRARYQQTIKQETPAPAETTEAAAPSKVNWNDVKDLPEVKEEISNTIRQALASRKDAAAEKLGKLTQALGILGAKYGIDVSDPDNIDYDALNKAVTDDDSLMSDYYEDKALEMGVDVETAARIDKMEKRIAADDRAAEQRRVTEMRNAHYADLQRQAAELKKVFPNFDLDAELYAKDGQFLRLTSPEINMPVETAYRAIHGKEIQAIEASLIAQRTQSNIANSIRANGMRPQENGTSSNAGSTTTLLYSQMSPSQRAAAKEQMRKAAMDGQKINPFVPK